jgi:hypothetical protein
MHQNGRRRRDARSLLEVTSSEAARARNLSRRFHNQTMSIMDIEQMENQDEQ